MANIALSPDMAKAAVNYAMSVIESKTYEFEGNPITFNRGNNIMVSATEMAKPFGKRPNDFLSAKSTQELINSLSVKTGISATELVVVNQGGSNQGTWLHEDLALIFAQWLSPTFYLWCNDRIKELLQVGMTATPATLEAMLDNPDLVIGLATKVKQLRNENKRQQELIIAQDETIKVQEDKIIKMLPKVSYVDMILRSPSTVEVTTIAQDYGMTAQKFNKILLNLRIQHKVGKRWVLYKQHLGNGYVQSGTEPMRNSKDGRTYTYTRWTQRGRLFLYDKLKSNGVLPLIEQN